jgi:hypothetical protein
MAAGMAIRTTVSEGPVGPSGPRPVLVTVSGTSSLVLDESVLGYAPVPGLSTTVTVPAGTSSDVLLETDGGIQINSPDPTAYCFVDVTLTVDGAQAGAGRRISVLNTPTALYSVGTYGFSTQATLSEGTHVVKVMARSIASLVAAPCYVSSAETGSALPGSPHLQGVLNVVQFP